KVALKLPHVGWAPGLAARLARERDILASLEHPNIARLYDAGVDPLGRPYLALEYVDGTPIDRYCTLHSLPLRERLALVLQVAAAVAHAHTRLVVHRDLKPSNILVTASGSVRLLDFGIAKLLQGGGESTELTRIAGGALTPDYASPEQIRGEPIGTPSDVYSLGVVTYELLAEVRPYRLARTGNLAEAIAETEPLPASRAAADPSARRHLAGDIDAILNKVLKKGTEERYPTVQDFAADIERHLRGEPVHARPNAPWYLAERWVRRHKLETGVAVAIAIAVPAGAAAQAAVLTALAAGAGLALWQARVARGQAERARAEASRAEQVKDFALSIFQEADTDAGAGAETTAADLLKAAQARVERELGGRPLVATELMTAIGYSLLGQGKIEEAGAILRKAVALGRRELGPQHPRTLAASVVYGEALAGLGQAKEAIALLTTAAAEARRQGAAHELINALRWLASAQLDAGQPDAAVESSQQAIALLASPMAARISKLDASEAWGSHANVLFNANRPGQVDAARRAVALAQELFGDKLTEPVINDRILLATGLAREGQPAAAIAELSTLLADAERVLGPVHPKVSFAAYFLGTTRLDAGDVVGAIDALRTSLAVAERSKVGGSYGLAMGHFHLASALAAARRGEEALPQFEAAAKGFGDAGGPDAPLALRALSARALALARLGRLDDADREFDALAHAPIAGLDKATHALRLAVLRSLQHRDDEAIALARSGAEDLRSYPLKEVVANADNVLGTVLLAGGHPAEAIAPLRRATGIYAQKRVTMSPDRAEALAALDRAQVEAAAVASAPAR
ncbi:MAG: serine/threonine-protein kinase, partial [Caldimonas sp.]